MDIYLSGKNDKNNTVKIRIPVLPSDPINLAMAGSYQEYDILDLGPVKVPNATELEELSFSSFFPGEELKDYPFIRGAWQKPNTYDNILSYWLKNGSDINVLITETSINLNMRLSKYEKQYAGAFGSISYALSFFTARNPIITSTVVKQTSTKTSGTSRAASTSKTYTIKSGDCLWNIAKKFYGNGSKWTTIYNANKSTIEARAKKAGKKSSSNGHWIYPGTVLVIP